MILYIARHGESLGNTGEDTGINPALSEKGHIQAELLGKRMVELPADEEISQKLFEAARNIEGTRAFRGIVATGDKFVSDSDERLAIGEEFSALACEMEGGAMAQVCVRAGVPFAILRSISDDIGHNTTVDFNEFKVMAAAKTIEVLKTVLS